MGRVVPHPHMDPDVLPGDVAGVVDRAKYTKLQLRAMVGDTRAAAAAD